MNDNFVFNPVQTTPFTLSIKVKSYLWRIINKTIFRIMPFQFRWYRIMLLRLFGANLSKNITISRTANIDHPWNLSMGSFSSLGDNCWIYCLDNIRIGEYCCIGKDVFIITGSHDVDSSDFALITKGIIINDGCWIATGSYIMPGVHLNKYSVVGARSVVTKDTESMSIVAGNPAKHIRFRDFSKLF